MSLTWRKRLECAAGMISIQPETAGALPEENLRLRPTAPWLLRTHLFRRVV